MSWQWVALILGLALNVTIICVAVIYMPTNKMADDDPRREGFR